MKNYLLVVLLLFTAPVQAKWIQLDVAGKQDEVHSYDPETIHRDGPYRKIWVLSSYDEKQTGGYHAVKSLYEFDCNKHKARPVTMLLYPDKNAAGVPIGAHHSDSKNWFGYSVNSMFRFIEETICID